MTTIVANETRFIVEERGNGVPLLLVHGFPLDHQMWSAQLTELSATFRVIAPDLRGFGQSDVTPGTVTMAQFADDLAGILDAVGVSEPVHLCGLSMGGYIAWHFFRRHRNRLGSLVLCDTRAVADSAEAKQNRIATADRVLAEGPQFLADAMLEKLFAEHTRSDRPELVDATRGVIMATSPDGIAAASRGMAERPDVSDWLSGIDVPTLVIVGEYDPISPPSEMRGIADSIPGAVFREIPGAGHMSPCESPHEVNTVLSDFLGRISR